MNQSAFSLLGAAEADEQEPDDTAPKRSRLVLLGALGVLAVAGAGVVLLTGGSPDAELAVPVAAPARASAAPVVTPTPATEQPADPAPARDPFEALYVPPPAGAGGAVSGVPAVGTPADVAVPSAPGAPAQPAAGTVEVPAAPPVADVPAVSASSALALTRVEGPATARRAVFSLDGEPVTAGVGDSFGGELLLLSVQQGPADGQWTAVVQVGQGEPFDVVTGEPAVRL